MSRRSSNTPEVPTAKDALDRFKFEVANEIGVPLKQGYNGDLTSRENGSVGGEMVRQMIRRQEEDMAHQQSLLQGPMSERGRIVRPLSLWRRVKKFYKNL